MMNKFILSFLLMNLSFMNAQTSMLVESFDTPTNLNWRIINDGVMGGMSDSEIQILPEGLGVFKGNVSLENNGGFASTRGLLPRLPSEHYTKMKLRIKGDGKKYSFRIRTDGEYDGVSYKNDFGTKAGDWQEITLLLADFKPTWRGRTLSNIPPIEPTQIRQIGFLISDKQAGPFTLLIDWIKLLE